MKTIPITLDIFLIISLGNTVPVSTMSISSGAITSMSIRSRSISSMSISTMPSITSMSSISAMPGISTMSWISSITDMCRGCGVDRGGDVSGVRDWGNVLDGDGMRGYRAGVGAGDDGVCRGAGGGPGLVGLDGGAESVVVGDVLDSSGSAVDVVDGVGSLLVAVSVSHLVAAVGSAFAVDDVVVEGVVAVALG